MALKSSNGKREPSVYCYRVSSSISNRQIQNIILQAQNAHCPMFARRLANGDKPPFGITVLLDIALFPVLQCIKRRVLQEISLIAR